MVKRHTKGPWTISDIDGDSLRKYIDNEEGHNGERDYYLVEVTHGDPDELDANALLVAAAPDMLHALRLAVGVLSSIAKMEPKHQRAFAAVEAAIAKAEGR